MSKVEIKGVVFECHYLFKKGEKETYDHPGTSDEIVFEHIFINNYDLLGMLSEETMNEIEECLVQEDFCNQKSALEIALDLKKELRNDAAIAAINELIKRL